MCGVCWYMRWLCAKYIRKKYQDEQKKKFMVVEMCSYIQRDADVNPKPLLLRVTYKILFVLLKVLYMLGSAARWFKFQPFKII